MRIAARDLIAAFSLLALSGCLVTPGKDGTSRIINSNGAQETTEETVASQPVPISGGSSSRSILHSAENLALSCEFDQRAESGSLGCRFLVVVNGVPKEPVAVAPEISFDWRVNLPGEENRDPGCVAGELPSTLICQYDFVPSLLRVDVLVKDSRQSQPVPYTTDVDTGVGIFQTLELEAVMAQPNPRIFAGTQFQVRGQIIDGIEPYPNLVLGYVVQKADSSSVPDFQCPAGGEAGFALRDSFTWLITGLDPRLPYRIHFCVKTPEGAVYRSQNFAQIDAMDSSGRRRSVFHSGTRGYLKSISVAGGDAANIRIRAQLLQQTVSAGRIWVHYRYDSNLAPTGCPRNGVGRPMARNTELQDINLDLFARMTAVDPAKKWLVFFCLELDGGTAEKPILKLATGHLLVHPRQQDRWPFEVRAENLGPSSLP